MKTKLIKIKVKNSLKNTIENIGLDELEASKFIESLGYPSPIAHNMAYWFVEKNKKRLKIKSNI